MLYISSLGAVICTWINTISQCKASRNPPGETRPFLPLCLADGKTDGDQQQRFHNQCKAASPRPLKNCRKWCSKPLLGINDSRENSTASPVSWFISSFRVWCIVIWVKGRLLYFHLRTANCCLYAFYCLFTSISLIKQMYSSALFTSVLERSRTYVIEVLFPPDSWIFSSLKKRT